MRWLIASLIALSLKLYVPLASADGAVYGELGFAGGAVQHSGTDFYPTFGSATLGFYPFRNIGIEGFVDAGIEGYDSDGLELDIDDAYGVALRFQSPAAGTFTQGYVVIGAVNYNLSQSAIDVSSSVAAADEDFVGVRISLGIMQRLRRFDHLQITAEYRHYNADEPLRVDALVLGVRVNAP